MVSAHPHPVTSLHRLLAALVLVCALMIAALAEGRRVEDLAYRYDAGHDILPDWIWNGGIPGNPYAEVNGHVVRR
jgi:hypothetical protein